MDSSLDEQKLTTIKQWLGSGTINIFGPPFAGKDTQGEILASLLGGILLGGGQILRSSTIPKRVQAVMDKGQLIPTEDFINIVLPYLSQPKFEGKPLVLSAVGRWHGEEPGVLEVTDRSNHPLKSVVFISLDEETIWQRWRAHKKIKNRGTRKDDEAGALELRLHEYVKKTPLVIEFYRDRGVLIEVEGNQPEKAITKQILDKLHERAAEHQ